MTSSYIGTVGRSPLCILRCSTLLGNAAFSQKATGWTGKSLPIPPIPLNVSRQRRLFIFLIFLALNRVTFLIAKARERESINVCLYLIKYDISSPFFDF